MPKLIVKNRISGEEKEVEFDGEILIGRLEGVDITLDSKGVSRRHAKLIRDKEDFYIIDLESKSGTFLNGIRLPKNEKYLLRNNDLIRIEDYDIRFFSLASAINQSFNEVTDSDILEVKLLKKVVSALESESLPSLEVLNGAAAGRKVFITDDISELTIGRDPTNGFQIEEPIVSRQHAKLVRSGKSFTIVDMGSKNGVYVNSTRVKESELHDGDRVALGTIVLMFRNPGEMDINAVAERIVPKKKREPLPQKKEEQPEEREEKAKDDDASPIEAPLPPEEEERLVKSVSNVTAYPAPRPKREHIRLGLMEIGFIGIGALIITLSIATLINLLRSP